MFRVLQQQPLQIDPNTDVFMVNSKGQAKTLLTYATTSSRNAGPWTLLSPITINMGSFSNICLAK
jgi:hypothetical protein